MWEVPLPARLWPAGRAAHDQPGQQEFRARRLFFAELRDEDAADKKAFLDVGLVDGGEGWLGARRRRAGVQRAEERQPPAKIPSQGIQRGRAFALRFAIEATPRTALTGGRGWGLRRGS